MIFVTGLHRSGTSLLHFLIGAAPGYVALGEIDTFIRSRDNLAKAASSSCSCGATISNCPFWGGLLPNLKGDGDYAPVLEHFRSHFPGQVPVDSSKHLHVLDQVSDAKVVCSIRDVRGWCVSMGKPTLRGYLSWYKENLRLKRSLSSRPHLMVSYDELALRPEASIQRIGESLGVCEPEAMLRFSDAEHHAVHANRMKDQPAKMAAIRYDYRWFNEPRARLPAVAVPWVMKFNADNVYGYVRDDFVDSPYRKWN